MLKSSNAEYKNFQVETNGSENETLEESFNGKKIGYKFFTIIFDRYLNGETEVTQIKQLIILYEDNKKLYLIIDKNTGAKTFLRLVLGFTENKKLEQVSNNVGSNFIIWLLYKVYNKEVVFELDNKKLILNTIIGFKGDTDDKLSTITASGDSLINILSTLSFLLESNLLNQISLRIEYADHKNVELKIDINDTLGVSIEKYRGTFKKDKYKGYSQLQQETLIYLLIYIEVFPIIKLWYSESLEDKEEIEDTESDVGTKVKWNKLEHIKFLEQVARDLTDKVNDKVSILNTRISD
ncbi:hypothetical protein SDC9_111555 [bioreactor metagenome]|uniref:Uncharacterized protein n=1 Tax=bioreactor metagenome TaxID=1076179 RepID=A0A645BH24_9ZZZZ